MGETVGTETGTHADARAGVEVAALAAGFAAALRRAGLSPSPDRAARLAEALRLVPPASREPLYWACRVVFVSGREQLPLFDTVFSAVFDGLLDPADFRGDRTAPPLIRSDSHTTPLDPELQTRPAMQDRRPFGNANEGMTSRPPAPMHAPGGSDDRPAHERDAILMMASSDERLHDMSFAELAPDEIAQMRYLVQQIVLSTPERRTRRTRRSPNNRDRLDIRRTVRVAQHTGGDAMRLVYARRRPRPRRLVLLCDVSGSMEPFTRVFLTLLQGAVSGARAEAFVFSTRLTRLTRQLAVHDPDRALARASASASDWAGGTRLAESIRSFVDGYGRRGLARGSVVVVFSDGWAQDDPLLVGAQMARLRRLAYRIIWVNPRKAAPGYQPVVGGMAAALPYCDAFVSGHSYAALADVAAAIHADAGSPQLKQNTQRSATRGEHHAT